MPRASSRVRSPYTYEWHRFMTHEGVKAFYRRAAELQGVSVDDWMREALHLAALSAHRVHGIEPAEVPPVHPIPPPPLQNRS